MGGGQRGPVGNGGKPIDNEGVTPRSTSARDSTNEAKAAKAIAKMLDVSRFNGRSFAYHFVTHAPTTALVRFFNVFMDVVHVMAERYDEDYINNYQELEVGVTSKRILDALGKYNEDT